MRAQERLWRTADGRLVADGDPDAATLGYAVGDDISPADEKRMPGAHVTEAEGPDGPGGAKARPRAANKARSRASDK